MTPFLYYIHDTHLSEVRAAKPGEAKPAPTMPQALTKRLEAVAADDWAKICNEFFCEVYGAPEGVLVLPVRGTLCREWWGGYEMLSSCLQSAQDDTRYRAVVLKVNSGGGAVDGCAPTADVIAGFGKPMLAHTNYCASAAYFLSSQTDEIWMEDGVVSQVGSIGTLLIYENYVKWLEQQGIELTIYRADQSPDKARVNAWEPLPEEGEREIKTLVNAAQREFEGYVKRGRAGRNLSNEALTGKMFGTKEALRLGLVDKKGSWADCLKAATKRAK